VQTIQLHIGQVAQLVEQRIENPRVGGSIPPLATTSQVETSLINRFRLIVEWKWAYAHFFLFFRVEPARVTTKVHTLIEATLLEHGYEMIEAEFLRARGLWRVFIDRADSRRGVDRITVDDCSTMTEVLLDTFEAENVEYEYLEVSSPGMDRVLTKPDHFERFAGETVKLTIEPAFNDLRRLSGELIGIDANEIRIDVDGVEHRVPYANVSRARVVPQF
jgi:ribosome maturation factor RimP